MIYIYIIGHHCLFVLMIDSWVSLQANMATRPCLISTTRRRWNSYNSRSTAIAKLKVIDLCLDIKQQGMSTIWTGKIDLWGGNVLYKKITQTPWHLHRQITLLDPRIPKEPAHMPDKWPVPWFNITIQRSASCLQAKHDWLYIYLGGGFKYFLCSSLFGEDSHFH